MKASHYRWVIITLLLLITMVNYIDRASLSYAVDAIASEFHLTERQIGWMLSFFGAGYCITTLLGGVFVDRFGSRRILTFALFSWSIAMCFTGFATGFISILMSRTLLGVCEGPNFPALARTASDWLSKEERTQAIAICLIAVPIALAIGGPIITWIMAKSSWRALFFILATSALLLAPIWWLFYKDNPKDSPHVNQAELALINRQSSALTQPTSHQDAWKHLLSSKTLLANYWAFFVFGYTLFFFMSWLPSYLEQSFHVRVKEVGLFSVLPWALAAIMMWLVGKLSDVIAQKTKRLRFARSYPILVSQLLAGGVILPLAFFHDLTLSIVCIALAVGFSMSSNACFYAVNIDITRSRAGSALGIMDAAFAISGFIAPSLTGYIVSQTGHYETAFGLLALLLFSSVMIVFRYHHPDQAISQDQEKTD